MDQPFESDVMEDLAAETPISSADYGFDEYESTDQGFEEDAFTDAIDDYTEEEAFSLDGDDFEDNLEGDLWDDYTEAEDEFKEHRSNQRESNRNRHEQGQRRRSMDQRGEAGDDRRRLSRRRPPGHRGPWPPRGNAFADEGGDALFDELDSLEEQLDADLGDDAEAGMDAIDAMEAAIADALEADDNDEFLRRAVRGIRRVAQVARQVGRGVGQVARVVAPIASAIPLPQAQAIGRVASLAGRLLADGADEFEVLDEMLAFAEAEDAIDAAAPMIAGLTVRTIVPSASRLNRTTRRQLVRSVRQSTQTLARRQGPQAARAIPRVVQAVQRTAQRRRVRAQQLPQAVRRATARVANNPRLVSRLARATQHASSVTGQRRAQTIVGSPQRLVIQGPVEITIRSR